MRKGKGNLRTHRTLIGKLHRAMRPLHSSTYCEKQRTTNQKKHNTLPGRVVLTSQTRRIKVVSSRGACQIRSLLPRHTTAYGAHAAAATDTRTARACTTQGSGAHGGRVGRSVERVVEQRIVVERGGVEHAHDRGAPRGVDTVEGGQVRGDATGDTVAVKGITSTILVHREQMKKSKSCTRTLSCVNPVIIKQNTLTLKKSYSRRTEPSCEMVSCW